MTPSSRRLADILGVLAVPRRSLVYVQASLDWMQKAGLRGPEALADLLDWVSPSGTLVMPTYPFHTTHREYLASRPIFDVRRTPSAIGLLPEMLRRTAGSRRSLDPDFCVSASGADAAAIVGDSPSGADPFGPDSSYRRMLDRDCTLLGLGVSLNTSSFIHAIDSSVQGLYPSPVYEPAPYETRVVDAGGVTHAVPRLALRPMFQQLIKPSRINDEMQPGQDVFRTVEIDGARFFAWRLTPWMEWCQSHARAASSAGRWPCWLSALEEVA